MSDPERAKPTSIDARRKLSTSKVALNALRFVSRSARKELRVAIGLEIASAGAIAGLLLFGRSLVAELTLDEGPSSVWDVIPQVVGVGASLLVVAVSAVAVREYRTFIAERVGRATQLEILDIATAAEFVDFERSEFHDLLDRANRRAASSAFQMVFDMLSIVNVLLTSVAVVGVLLGTAPAVLPALLLVAVPFVVAARASATLGFRTTYALTPDDRLRSYLYRALTNRRDAREVRVFGSAEHFKTRWAALYERRLGALHQVLVKRLVWNGLAAAIAAAMVAAVIAIVVRSAVRGDILLADAAVAIVGLQQLASRIRTASTSAGSLRQSALFLDEFDRFRSSQRSRRRDGSPAAAPAGTALELRGVSFTYEGAENPALQNVSVSLQPGEVVALVGESGSGKSTLAHLVAGLYKQYDGEIVLGGVERRDFSDELWFAHVTAVFQDFSRYELTARENIAASAISELSPGRVEQAAESAEISETINALPSRYDTILSRAYEDGTDLSLGQWQRLAVARAFFRDAPLLVLDEPASALDARAEWTLHQRVRELVSDRSALLISHRFSTVRLADRIIMLQNGRVVEEGTHEELLQMGSAYANLYRLQIPEQQ